MLTSRRPKRADQETSYFWLVGVGAGWASCETTVASTVCGGTECDSNATSTTEEMVQTSSCACALRSFVAESQG